MNTTADHIAYDRAQILYARKGGRYVQVNDPWAYSGLREGTFLVKVQPNCTTIRQMVWPDRAEIDAALRDLEDELVDLIRKASEARPRNQTLTPAEKKAWDHLVKVGGESFSIITYDSIAGIAETISKRVRGKVEERLGT